MIRCFGSKYQGITVVDKFELFFERDYVSVLKYLELLSYFYSFSSLVLVQSRNVDASQ